MPSSPTALSDIFGGLSKVPLGPADADDFFDESGRYSDKHAQPVSTGKYRAPFITGKELEHLSPDVAKNRVTDALTTAVQDRQILEEKLERLEEVQADPNEIRQAQVDLRRVKEVHAQLIRIRDQMLPRRQKLVDLYTDVGGTMDRPKAKRVESPDEIIARQIDETQLAALNEEGDAGRTGRRVSGVDPSKPTDEQLDRRAKLAEYGRFGSDTGKTIKGPGM
jgi:hypothetical protein